MKQHLQIKLSKEDYEEILQRYHFETANLEDIQAMEKAAGPFLDICFFYQIIGKEQAAKLPRIPFEDYAVAVATIGSGLDELIELYLAHEGVLNAYILDCLGLTFLSKSYKELVEAVNKESGRYVSRLEFLGDACPIELTPAVLEILGLTEDKTVGITDNFMLTPLKSVCLVLPLQKEKPEASKENICNSCATCSNLNCTMRKVPLSDLTKIKKNMASMQRSNEGQSLNYGYQQIFGRNFS